MGKNISIAFSAGFDSTALVLKALEDPEVKLIELHTFDFNGLEEDILTIGAAKRIFEFLKEKYPEK